VLSNRLAASVSLLAAHNSFADAGRMLQELVGVKVDDNTVALVAESAGAAVMAANDASVEEALEHRRPASSQVQPVPQRLYVSTDGANAPIIGGWREVRCGVVYWKDARGDLQARYIGRIEDHKAFGRRLWHLACECGLREAPEVVMIGDGAPWIWKQAQLRFGRAVQILDWYHASEHVWKCAHAMHGEGTTTAKHWADRMLGVLYKKGGKTLLDRLTRSSRGRGKVPESLLELIGYVESNAERMDYPSYRKAGLSIGSGPVESACKRLVGGRLKGPGMHWTVAGADSILALRTTWYNGQWQSLWQSKPLAA